MNVIQEGKISLQQYEGTVSKDLPVFYNPDMKFNRDVSIHVLNSVEDMDLSMAFPMAGTGIRPLRFIKELNEGKISHIAINDLSKDAIQHIKKQFKFNKLKWRAIKRLGLLSFSQTEASVFMLSNPPFDYIDIDPFGYPGPFLDAAVKRVKHGGILAVTATDTSALAGTYKKACMRKYLAVPKKDGNMHETGLRILIRRCQIAGLTYDKALTPIYSFSKDHYMRVFFRVEQQKEKAADVFKQFGSITRGNEEVGPLWLGKMWDIDLAKEVAKQDEENAFLQTIAQEAEIDTIGFFHVHDLCEELKINVPKFNMLVEHIKEKGYNVSKTHFTPLGLKSTMPKEEFLELLKITVN